MHHPGMAAYAVPNGLHQELCTMNRALNPRP